MTDTIAALSTPTGGALAVIRVSGPLAAQAAKALLSKDVTGTPRQLTHVRIVENGVLIDEAMAAFLPAPRTYTGEDMLEITCHGGAQVCANVLSALLRHGARPAEAGEFTRRAFVNGKMDLSQAEAVMDVINAAAEQSAKAALRQLTGRLRTEIEGIEALLIEALSAVDAAIDYPEELEEDVAAELPLQLREATMRTDALIAQGRQGRVLREGFSVVLAGRPNAGKSSLLNALLGRPRAIVTAAPGTTRDTLEEALAIGGIPMRLTDTAGLREAAQEAEKEGISRAKAAMDDADLLLIVLDRSEACAATDRSEERRAGDGWRPRGSP